MIEPVFLWLNVRSWFKLFRCIDLENVGNKVYLEMKLKFVVI